MKFTNICFFLGLIAIASSLKVNSQTAMTTEPDRSYRVKASIFKLSVDDQIMSIYVNNRKQELDFNEQDGKTCAKVKTQKLYLVPGDTIKITGRNLIVGNTWLIGTLQYYDLNGIEHIYQTDGSWKCDGVPAIVKGARDSITWVSLPTISSQAQFIWKGGVSILKEEVTCEFTIPRCF